MKTHPTTMMPNGEMRLTETDAVLCDGNCNECPIIGHENSRMLTAVLNALVNRFGDDAAHIIQKHCPNFTCCFDCRIDDFCHTEGCTLITSEVPA